MGAATRVDVLPDAISGADTVISKRYLFALGERRKCPPQVDDPKTSWKQKNDQ